MNAKALGGAFPSSHLPDNGENSQVLKDRQEESEGIDAGLAWCHIMNKLWGRSH